MARKYKKAAPKKATPKKAVAKKAAPKKAAPARAFPLVASATHVKRAEAAPKKEAPPRRGKPSPLSEAQVAEAYERWMAGTQVVTLARDFTRQNGSVVSQTDVRTALKKRVGGTKEYNALREQGAGGSREAFGGTRGGGAQQQQNDTDVPRVESMCKSDGWRFATEWIGGLQSYIAISPEGLEYVPARPNERADLLHIGGVFKEQRPIRLRLLETSALARKARREALEAEEAAAEQEERKAAKKAKRGGARNAEGTMTDAPA